MCLVATVWTAQNRTCPSLQMKWNNIPAVKKSPAQCLAHRRYSIPFTLPISSSHSCNLSPLMPPLEALVGSSCSVPTACLSQGWEMGILCSPVPLHYCDAATPFHRQRNRSPKRIRNVLKVRKLDAYKIIERARKMGHRRASRKNVQRPTEPTCQSEGSSGL